MSNLVIINGMQYKLIAYGHCQCGCGQKTKPASCTLYSRGWIRGKPLKYVHGHNCKGSDHYRWQDGTHITTHGYTKVLLPEHPNSDSHGHVLVSVLKAEKALGKYLPRSAKMHHLDGNTLNDENSNLVLCQDQAYHMLLEKRTRAYRVCGHANWLLCWFCQQYDSPDNMYTYTRPGTTLIGFHRACQAKYKKDKIKRGPKGSIKIWTLNE